MNNFSRRTNALNAGSILAAAMAAKAPTAIAGSPNKPRGRESKAHGRLTEQS